MDENSSGKGLGYGMFVAIILAIGFILIMCSSGRSDSMIQIETCGTCGKDFVSSANRKSIQNTTMCEKCYQNVRRGQGDRKSVV